MLPPCVSPTAFESRLLYDQQNTVGQLTCWASARLSAHSLRKVSCHAVNTHIALWWPLCEELRPPASCHVSVCISGALHFLYLRCFGIFKILLIGKRLPFPEGASS